MPGNVLILGGSGYVGSAFQSYLQQREIPFRSVARSQVDYADTSALRGLLRDFKPSFLINAAGFTGKPNVDACETQKAATLMGNAVLPGIIREACEAEKVTWGHVSSGCIYSGRRADGGGFREDDEPNFSFRRSPCSFYSGTKALGEEVLEGAENCYIWRLRIPFDAENSPRNYLVKLIRYSRLLEAENSISERHEFCRACFECYEKQVPFGIYNVTQPGTVHTSDVVRWIREEGDRRRAAGLDDPFPESFQFFEDEKSFMEIAAKTPRSNCVLDTAKLDSVGINLTPVEDAVRRALRGLLA